MTTQEIENSLIGYAVEKEGLDIPVYNISLYTAVDFIEHLLEAQKPVTPMDGLQLLLGEEKAESLVRFIQHHQMLHDGTGLDDTNASEYDSYLNTFKDTLPF